MAETEIFQDGENDEEKDLHAERGRADDRPRREHGKPLVQGRPDRGPEAVRPVGDFARGIACAAIFVRAIGRGIARGVPGDAERGIGPDPGDGTGARHRPQEGDPETAGTGGKKDRTPEKKWVKKANSKEFKLSNEAEVVRVGIERLYKIWKINS